MKSLNSTSYLLRGWTTLSMLFLLLMGTNTAQAQYCTIACNDNVQVSLGTDCKAVITYDMILEDADNSRICSPNGPQAFVIQVLDHKGEVIASTDSHKDYITCEDVAANDGNTFQVMAKHWATGNRCWGTITVEDKIAPKLWCKPVYAWCNQPFTPDFIECHFGKGVGYPEVRDNCDELRDPVYYPNANGVTCGPIELTYEDEIKDVECADHSYPGMSAVIYRHWTAVDASGNVGTCTQKIYLQRATIDHIDLRASLPHYTGLPGDMPPIERTKDNNCSPNTDPGLILDGECPDGEGNDVGERTRPGAGGDSGEPTGFPMIHGIPVTKYKENGLDIGYQYPWDSYGFCEINVTYKDHEIPVCVGSYKIIRTWKLVDWCTNEIRYYDQIIKVVDHEATIDCPSDQYLYTNDYAKDCVADFNIPDGQIWEACGEVSSAYVTITGYRYSTKPYANWAVEEYEVLHREGTVVGSPTGDPVFIDYGYTELAGPDCGQEYAEYKVTYNYIDHCGNEDECTYKVYVKDETAPTPICDEVTQVTVGRDCEAIVPADRFDSGSYDNCDPGPLTFEVRRMGSGDDFAEHIVFNAQDVWDSAEGTPVMVEMRVTDCHGNSNTCMVEAYVDDKTPPTIEVEDALIYCEDLENNGVIPADLIPEPVVDDNCPDPTYEEVDRRDWRNECYIGKLEIDYQATDKHGLKSRVVTQTIYVEDNTPLDVVFPEDYLALCTAEDGSGFTDPLDPSVTGEPIIYGDDCELVAISHEDEILRISDEACFKIARYWRVIDWCAYDPEHPSQDAYFEYVQFIKVLDQVPPQLEVEDDRKVCIDGTNDCFTSVDVAAPEVTDCSSEVRVRAEWTYTPNPMWCGVADAGTVADASAGFTTPDFEPGTLEVTFIADDGCNNVTKETVTYTIEDCKKPTPYCHDGIRIELMPSTGMVEVWASDLDLGSFDNCDGCATEGLIFSFSEDTDDQARTFECSQVGVQNVQIWVTDKAGNQDFCETFVMVQDNMFGCTGIEAPEEEMAAVAGKVANLNGELVQEVTVGINAEKQSVTSASGDYAFDLQKGGDYTITPSKNMNPLNGVSTYDLVLLRKHILGTEVLDNPYSQIAADINRSGTITTFDLVELRKVILQVQTTFTDNESWRFVDAGYQFSTDNPLGEAFPEVYNINNLASDMNVDFVAIKVGDLNGTAVPNSLVSAEARNTVGTLELNVQDQYVNAGELVEVAFSADMTNKAGFQFTMDFAGLELVDLAEGAAKSENFNLNLAQRGMLTASWDGVADNSTLFKVTFKANTAGQLSQLLSINSSVTEAEAYTTAGQPLDVAINFTATEGAEFALYQNVPNPFNGETVIGFNMPQAGTATLKVMDIQGKILLQRESDFNQGLNQFLINANELNANGVLYYQLESADNIATRKMIILE